MMNRRSVGGVINTGMFMPVYDMVWKTMTLEFMLKLEIIFDEDRGVGTFICLNMEREYDN